ncbi:mitochondrial import receptor subunit tom20 [Sorochytrium milnesiophthora]
MSTPPVVAATSSAALSSSSSSSSTLQRLVNNKWLVAGSTVAALLIGYAVYFDSKRRNDPAFRKQLQREKRRLEKAKANRRAAEAKLQGEAKTAGVSDDATPTPEGAMAFMQDEAYPTTIEDKEKYFMDQLAKGELLTKNGPSAFEAAAACFYKALKVYPSPAELIMLYQRTIPDTVLNLVMGMLSLEVKKKQEQYYEQFPPAEMNVKVVQTPDGVSKDGKDIIKRTLVLTRDVEQGETIYSEKPIIAALEPALEKSASYCSFCLKHIGAGMTKHRSQRTELTYCCAQCEETAWTLYDHFLYAPADSQKVEMSTAHVMAMCRDYKAKVPLMIARFLSYMVHEDQKKTEELKAKAAANGGEVKMDDDTGYTVWDHIERMKFLELKVTEKAKSEARLLRDVLGRKVPGLDEFLTDERYITLKGKFLYNMVGVTSAVPTNPKSSKELQRSRETNTCGAGLYPVTAFIQHSCAPNAVLKFVNGDSELSLVAEKPLKAGDQVTISFIDLDHARPAQAAESESSSDEGSDEDAEAKRARAAATTLNSALPPALLQRQETLHKGWRFKCGCDRCLQEALESLE